MSKRKLYPVIHCVDPYTEQGIGHALANVRTAEKSGADGVFLIGHGMACEDLVLVYDHTRKNFPDFWIGINFLDISSRKNWGRLSEMAKQCHNLNALWIDDMPNRRLEVKEGIQVFGGVAFKYINPNQTGKELSIACDEAVQFVDVATTSGNKTGSPPDVKKLENIRENLRGRMPLALASGVSAKNISMFSAVDMFLVSTSISEPKVNLGGHEYLVEEKVGELRSLIDLLP